MHRHRPQPLLLVGAGLAALTLAGLLLASFRQPAPERLTPSPTPPLAYLSPATLPAVAPPLVQANESLPTPPAPTPPPPSGAISTTVLPRYILTATLDYAAHRLEVHETIRYTNRSVDTLPELVLMVEPLYFRDAFHLEEALWKDGLPVKDIEIDGGWIRFPMPEPLPPAGAIELSLHYTLNLPSPKPSPTTRPIPFGYSDHQTNLVDWYPFVPPYVPGKGWLAHPAGYYGEHLAYESSDFEVSLRLAGFSRPLVVAASASPDRPAQDWRHYELPAARNFALSISPDYEVFSTTVGTTAVWSYALPVHRQAGRAVLQTTADALQLYNRLYGQYPRASLSAVEADFLDGMEFDGLYFLSNGFYNLYTGTPGEYLVAIAAHETAHEWWYGQVGNDQALEPWLDEALCTYSERLFFEDLHPEALDWWWTVRVNYYSPRGWVSDSIYNPHKEENAYRAYRDAVYLNGALFLEDLRKLAGDEAFFAFLKDYLQQYTHRLATSQGFFSVLKTHTSVDLTPLLEKYFERPESLLYK